MKRVGILTFHRVINYGALLQAYALQRKIEELGFDAEIIDYASAGTMDQHHGNAKDSMMRKVLIYASNPTKHYGHIKRRLELRVVRRLEDQLFKKQSLRQFQSFELFKEGYLKISNRSYNTIDDLNETNRIYDSIIAGSDQVWNPFITQNDISYFLSFVKDDNKKISYATSFGSRNIPVEFQHRIVPLLKKIRHLSARETSGAELVSTLSGRDVEIVVDPTLLLTSTQWEEIIKDNRFEEPYIFCYAFFDNPAVRRLCRHLSRITGFKIIRLTLYPKTLQRIKESLDSSTVYVSDSGPLECLALFKKASVVVTNSFHGLMFSVNFKKDIFVVSPELGIERIIDFLRRYNLNDRLKRFDDDLPAKEDIKIDYAMVEPVLRCEREKSIEFLKNSLNSL